MIALWLVLQKHKEKGYKKVTKTEGAIVHLCRWEGSAHPTKWSDMESEEVVVHSLSKSQS